MLHKLYLTYKDGTEEEKLIHTEPGEIFKIYPRRDGIVLGHHKTFKYEVPKHEYLSPMIVNLRGKYVIMPYGIECHPKTTLSDIKVITKRKNKKREKKQLWKFDSSSGNGTYTVQKVGDTLRCNCPGVWRAKDRKCKHIKEVENG